MRQSIAIIPLLSLMNFAYAAEAPLGSDPGTEPYPYRDRSMPWQEQQVTIPAPPRDADLVGFGEVPGRRGLTLYLDRRALSVGERDRVSRYTVVLESSSGARNVFYEGLRCSEGDFRRYAFASGDRPFEAVDDQRWHPPTEGRLSRYREYLADTVLCNPHGRPFAPREVIARAGRPLPIEQLDY